MFHLSKRPLGVLGGLVVFVSILFGQVDTGRIVGTVMDGTETRISDAQIRLANEDTGLVRQVTTDKNGWFSSGPLPVGRYKIAVRAKGDLTEQPALEGIQLEIGETASVELVWQPLGVVSRSVDVTGDAPLLTVTEAAQSQIIDSRRMADLPLNGRDYIQLALLTSGSIPPPANSRSGGYASSGMRVTQNNYLLDGVDNNNNQNSIAAFQAEAVKPAVDAIREFRISNNLFSAEYGRAVGGVVNVALKSGSNEFHGTAFDFLRNEDLDAKNFFDLPDQPKPPFKRNQYGFSLGGPIIKNKTFFFGDYEGTRIRESGTANNTIPTPLQVSGDFSERLPNTRIYDPDTFDPETGIRQPFANNVIPASRIDPVGAGLTALYPQPNKPGLTQNFLFNPPANENLDRWDARLDHNASERVRLRGRFSFQDREQPSSPNLPAPALGATREASDFQHDGRNLMLGYEHVLSPRALLSIRGAWNKIITHRTAPLDQNLNSLVGLSGVEQTAPGGARVIPAGFSQLGPGLNVPRISNSQTRQIVGDLTWTRGRHSFKFGTNLSWIQSDVDNLVWKQSRLRFDGGFTRNTETLREGNSIADILLGTPFETAISNAVNVQQRTEFYNFYAQDEWRVTERLTLNMGIRYELQMPLVDKHDRLANFDTNLTSPRLLVASGGSRFDRALIETDANNFGPRFGFAYRAGEKSVLRGGYGVYYTNLEGFGDIQGLMGNPPFHVKVIFASNRITPNIVLRDGVPEGSLNLESAANVATSSSELSGRIGYAQQWNFAIQRELTHNTLVEVGYYGNTAHKLTRRTEGNWALPGPGGVNSRRIFRSLLVPGENIELTSLANTFRHEQNGNATFHSLQARLEKRLSGGLSVLSSYVWSKTIGDAKGASGAGGNSNILPQNPLDLRAERSLADEHVAHRFVASYIYELPIGRGRAWLADANPAVQAILGGWSFSGITSMQTGTVSSLTVRGNPSGTGGPDRPDALFDWVLPGSRRSPEAWFDTSAFAPNAARTFGNAGRNLIENPGIVNFDFAVFKNFPITEGSRIQFRFESFNIFNTPHFGPPNTQVGTGNLGRITSAGRPRNLQFGLKFVF